MKKFAAFTLIFTLLVPVATRAATEFSLGGFIKLDLFWDSTQNGSHKNIPILRENNPNFHHGRFSAKAQESRFNFTIKGPKLWGAQTTGFIEMDFDPSEEGMVTSYSHTAFPAVQRGAGASASGSHTPRLRHAMVRLNWPETELLLGQYWSMFSEWWPEVAENAPFHGVGTFVARAAQVRLTQTFLSDWTVAAYIGQPAPASLPSLNASPYGIGNNGEAAESPQIQAKIRYQRDWWGKAPYYGTPTPFTVQITAGWQRNVMRPQTLPLLTFGQDAYVNLIGSVQHQYFNPWLVMGTVFIPVIPTHTFNMAGTASILAQWWIGQGVEAFGSSGIASNLYRFSRNFLGNNLYDVELQNRWGGYIQGQYYFNNQWFMNATYGMSKAFGISQNQDPSAPGNREIALSADQQKIWQQVDVILWYRPIMPLKFGVQYSFGRTIWLQKIGDAVGMNSSDSGTEHRVQFVGFFFF